MLEIPIISNNKISIRERTELLTLELMSFNNYLTKLRVVLDSTYVFENDGKKILIVSIRNKCMTKIHYISNKLYVYHVDCGNSNETFVRTIDIGNDIDRVASLVIDIINTHPDAIDAATQ